MLPPLSVVAVCPPVVGAVVSPQAARERLETRLELWLDTEIAPTLSADVAKDDAELVGQLIDALNDSVEEMQNSLRTAAEGYAITTRNATVAYSKAIEEQKAHLRHFDGSLDKFSEGVHDFSEVDYNLRGSVERMDLAVRDLASALREVNRRMGNKQ